MMEFIKFTFSNFWVFIGMTLLILIIGDILVSIVKAIFNYKPKSKKERTARNHRVDYKIEFFDPTVRDLAEALSELPEDMKVHVLGMNEFTIYLLDNKTCNFDDDRNLFGDE